VQTTSEDLTRVADLLGSPVADHEHSDPTSGVRSRYTGRAFGRVHLEAFTPVGRDQRR